MSKSILKINLIVFAAVRAYYDMNGTNRFSYSRTFTKTEEDNIYNSIFPSEFLSSWTEKTTLTCADAFPTVLKRTEVVDREVEEFTPLEISLESIEKRTIELLALEKRYSAIKESESPKINTNPLAMALNDAVDTGSAGIPLFRNSTPCCSSAGSKADMRQSSSIHSIEPHTLIT